MHWYNNNLDNKEYESATLTSSVVVIYITVTSYAVMRNLATSTFSTLIRYINLSSFDKEEKAIFLLTVLLYKLSLGSFSQNAKKMKFVLYSTIVSVHVFSVLAVIQLLKSLISYLKVDSEKSFK